MRFTAAYGVGCACKYVDVKRYGMPRARSVGSTD